MRERLAQIKEHKLFQIAVTIVILFSSLVIGISTYDFDPKLLRILFVSDYFITIFFVIEILIRFFSEIKKISLKMAGIFSIALL